MFFFLFSPDKGRTSVLNFPRRASFGWRAAFKKRIRLGNKLLRKEKKRYAMQSTKHRCTVNYRDWIFSCILPFLNIRRAHRKKGFVILTKSFVKIGITKMFFFYNNKMFSSINKTFGCCSKIFGCSKKKIVVPNFVAIAKPFFSVAKLQQGTLPEFQITYQNDKPHQAYIFAAVTYKR